MPRLETRSAIKPDVTENETPLETGAEYVETNSYSDLVTRILAILDEDENEIEVID